MKAFFICILSRLSICRWSNNIRYIHGQILMQLIIGNIVKPTVLNILDIQGYKTTKECAKISYRWSIYHTSYLTMLYQLYKLF
jgi:hypothetical protein